VVVAMASSKVAYVAFGEDASIGFAGDDALNRPSSRSFDDPPWKVIDSDIHFKPMFVEGFAPVEGGDEVPEARTETANPNETPDDGVSDTKKTDGDESGEYDRTDEEAPEWAEVAEVETFVSGISEDEVVNRIEEAVANVRAELIDEYSQKISELEASIASLKSDHETQCQQIREQTQAEAEAKVEKTIHQYRELTQKIRAASTRVSEFFEPISRLSVHIAEQLVRGELTLGPVAITRLVQGCLDAIEERASNKEPILKMHPADLETFLSGFDGELTGVSLMADDRLARGDVSLQMDHSVIDDLLSHRLEEIAQYVFGRSTRDSDLLLDEETSAILASDTISLDAADTGLTDPSESAGESSNEESPSLEVQPRAEDLAMTSESEQQMIEEAGDAPQNFESTASTDQSDQDLSVPSDPYLGEGQIDGDASEVDGTDDSTL
jgi:flagellar biosynthesis/type III secretory pathway protein FliH